MSEQHKIDDAVASWARIVPDLDVATMRTGLMLARLSALAQKYVESAFATVGLSSGEFDVLASLIHSPDNTSKPSLLARTGMLSPAGMTHRLDLLERAGFVKRVSDPDDRRSTLVVLTPAGESKAIEAARVHVEAEKGLLGALSSIARDDLRRLLELLLDSFGGVSSSSVESSN